MLILGQLRIFNHFFCIDDKHILTVNSSPNVKDEVLSAINAPANNMKIIEKLITDYILPSDKKGNIYEISQAMIPFLSGCLKFQRM